MEAVGGIEGVKANSVAQFLAQRLFERSRICREITRVDTHHNASICIALVA